MACTVYQVHYSFIFSILTCLGQCLHHLWIASDSEGKRKQRISFHNLEKIQRRLLSSIPDIVFSFFHSFEKQKIFMWLSCRVYQRLSRNLLLIKSFFAPVLCQKRGAYCCSLTQLISLYWLNWRPSSKGPLGGGPSLILTVLAGVKSRDSGATGFPPSVSEACVSWCIMHYR